MKFGRHGVPYFFIRLGIGFAFLWLGADMFRHSEIWTTLVPDLNFIDVTQASALQIIRIIYVAVGLLFVFNYWPRITACLAAICLLLNLFGQYAPALAARDIGLLGIALALLFWPYHSRRRWWRRFWPKKKETFEFDE